ncbi:DUF6234 family protein [Streptomyces hundungensis]|uniref:DUF6234 family protein n=1 Tax=Streptomyces hundungensis TaxID=1077946 RepID=UPI0033CF906F
MPRVLPRGHRAARRDRGALRAPWTVAPQHLAAIVVAVLLGLAHHSHADHRTPPALNPHYTPCFSDSGHFHCPPAQTGLEAEPSAPRWTPRRRHGAPETRTTYQPPHERRVLPGPRRHAAPPRLWPRRRRTARHRLKERRAAGGPVPGIPGRFRPPPDRSHRVIGHRASQRTSRPRPNTPGVSTSTLPPVRPIESDGRRIPRSPVP